MGSNFSIDENLLKGQMKVFYDRAKTAGGDVDKFDSPEDLNAFMNSVMKAMETAKKDADYKNYLGFDDNDVNTILGFEKSSEAQSNHQVNSTTNQKKLALQKQLNEKMKQYNELKKYDTGMKQHGEHNTKAAAGIGLCGAGLAGAILSKIERMESIFSPACLGIGAACGIGGALLLAGVTHLCYKWVGSDTGKQIVALEKEIESLKAEIEQLS